VEEASVDDAMLRKGTSGGFAAAVQCSDEDALAMSYFGGPE
jgi:hypothetical protein